MKIIILTQAQKKHNVNALHDAFIAAEVIPLRVEGTTVESRFMFDDAASDSAIQAVVDAYAFTNPPVPVDLRAAWQAYKDAVQALPAGQAKTTFVALGVLLKELFKTRDSGLI